MTRRFHILFLLVLALAVYVGSAGTPALMDDADGGHALVPREMLESHDFAVMHINGIRWLEKAPLHYWLVAASYSLLGESAFSTRLPLALGVVGLVLMVYVFGRHFFDEQAGFYAGLAICTCIGTWTYTRAMIPEALYALQFTAVFYLFLRAWQGTLPARAGYWGCAAVMGLAVLTRALIGLIFPLGAITLNFNEPVTVSGTPQLALNSGATVNYASGSGTSTCAGSGRARRTCRTKPASPSPRSSTGIIRRSAREAG